MRVACAAVFILAIAILVSPAYASGERSISGAEFEKLARTSEVKLDGATITSKVDLSDAKVAKPFTCLNCRFRQAFVAVGTTFKSLVDVRGSTFAGNVNFAKASFADPAVFGSPSSSSGVHFAGSTDFSLATFHDLATFENGIFQERDAKTAAKSCDAPVPDNTDFQLARFDAGATFATDAIFGDADFRRTLFTGTVDFSNTSFVHQAMFDGTEFQGAVDFGEGNFKCSSSFASARFDKGASFVHRTFPAPSDSASVSDSFEGLQCGGALDFSFAVLSRSVSFNSMVVNGGITFHGASFGSNGEMTWANVAATSLDMDVAQAKKAIDSTDLPKVLADIESSAKASGDLGRANDADYELKVLESNNRGWFGHALDFVFYRTMAGYLVRPLQPLAALLILAAIMTLVHAGRKAWPHPARTSRGWWNRCKSEAGRIRRILPPLGTAYLATLALVVPGKGPSAAERPIRWLEVIAYRLLFVCMLIGLANTNPTLRQMLDAIR